MAEGDRILSQQEVDALLSAIDSGEVEVAPQAESAPCAVPYDFRRPDRVPPGKLRDLEMIHEVYARGLQTLLSGMLRAGVEARVSGVDQMSYVEFVGSLPNPTVFAVLSAEPLPGGFVLEIDPSIAFPIIERLLGSCQPGPEQPQRPLTAVEWGVIDRVIAGALDLLGDMWAPAGPVAFRVRAREANPRLVQALGPDESVVSVGIEVSLGGQKGMWNLCIPVAALEGRLESVSSRARVAPAAAVDSQGRETAITRRLAPAGLGVSVHLPVEEIGLGAVVGLRPGDMLLTGHPSHAPVHVSLEGRVKFLAAVGRDRERKAFRVLRRGDEPCGGAPPRASVVKAPAEGEPGGGRSMIGPLMRVPLPVAVVVAEKDVAVGEVLGLAPGRILDFPRRADESLGLEAGGRLIGECRAVKVGERFGFRVEAVVWDRPGP